MAKDNVVDISQIEFTSTVNPTEEDIRLWESLSEEQQKTLIEREEEAAFRSGLIPRQTMAEVITELRLRRSK